MTDKDKPAILLEHYLKKLKLPTILREYPAMAVVCRNDKSDFQTYLMRLAERELLDREKRAAERRVRDCTGRCRRRGTSLPEIQPSGGCSCG